MGGVGSKIPNPFTTLVITGNPTLDAKIRYALFGLFVFLLGMMGGWLNHEGFHDPAIYTVYLPTGLALALSSGAVAAWGIIRSSKLEAIIKFREAIGVQAGLNLAASGDMCLTTLGNQTIPVPVTVDSAQEIIANHGTPIVKP